MGRTKLFPPIVTAALWLALFFLGLQSARASSSSVIISALYYDTYLSGEPDEAIRLTNVSGSPQSIAGWTLGDGEGAVTLTSTLDSGNSVWVTANAISFTLEFGFAPDYEFASDSDPLVPQLPFTGTLSLANDGDEVVLRRSEAGGHGCHAE